MLRHGLDRAADAAAIEAAVDTVLAARPPHPGPRGGAVRCAAPDEIEVGTEEITDAMLEELQA